MLAKKAGQQHSVSNKLGNDSPAIAPSTVDHHHRWGLFTVQAAIGRALYLSLFRDHHWPLHSLLSKQRQVIQICKGTGNNKMTRRTTLFIVCVFEIALLLFVAAWSALADTENSNRSQMLPQKKTGAKAGLV